MPFTTPMAHTRISPYSKRSSTLSSVGPSKILTASSNAMLCWAMFRRFFLGPNCNSWRHIYIMYLRRRKAQSHRRHPRHPAIGRAALHAVDSNMSLRPVKRLIKAKPTLEGAGGYFQHLFPERFFIGNIQFVNLSHRLLNAEIIYCKNIFSAKSKHEEHLNSPAANAF